MPIRRPAGKLVVAVHVPFWSATVKNLLAVALLVSVASIALSQAPAPPTAEQNSRQRTPENFQKCEYKVLDLGKHDAETIEKALNAGAKEGFELERVIGDRIGIMRRNFRSVRIDQGRAQQGPNS